MVLLPILQRLILVHIDHLVLLLQRRLRRNALPVALVVALEHQVVHAGDDVILFKIQRTSYGHSSLRSFIRNKHSFLLFSAPILIKLNNLLPLKHIFLLVEINVRDLGHFDALQAEY